MRGLLSFLLLLVTSAALAQAVPTVTFTALPVSGVSPLTTNLTWSSTGASTCAASGGWTGAKATSGTQVITGVTANTTYTLTCSTSAGTAQLSWTAPTQNTDGTPLTNLAGYQAFRAATSAGLATATSAAEIAIPALTYTLTGIPAGTWYFAMRSKNSAGAVSDLSNVVSKTIALQSASANASVTVSTVPNPPVLVTVNQVAYELKYGHGETSLGRLVGYIDLGVACGAGPIVKKHGQYYEVPLDQVELVRMPRSIIVVAKCASS